MRRRTKDRGVAILTILVLVIIIGGISSAFFLLALNESNTSEATRYKARATYLAEAGAEVAANDLRQICAIDPTVISTTPTSVPAQVNGSSAPTVITVPPPTDFSSQYSYISGSGLPINFPVPLPGQGKWGNPKTVTIDGFPVQYNVFKRTPSSQSPNATTGLNMTSAAFEIMAYARVGADATNKFNHLAQEAVCYRTVETQGTPLFQFLAFYANDLEINPGPIAHFHGRIHTNGDLYVTDRDTSGVGLILDSNFVHASGNMYRTYAGTPPVETGANGNVWVRQSGTTPVTSVEDTAPWNDPGLVNWGLGLNSLSTGFESTAQTNWNGTLQDHQPTLATPPIGTVQAGGSWQNAASGSGNLIITNTSSGPVVTQNGTPVTLPAGTVTTSSIYDAREQTTVPVITVDVGKLMNSSFRPQGGIIYATDPGATSSAPTGIQLVNGGVIPPPGFNTDGSQNSASSADYPGLSVATNLPVYVKGDFNGTTNSNGRNTQVPVTDPNTGLPKLDNSGNPVMQNMTVLPNGTQVPSQPCSIIADAVTLLSNNWTGGTPGSIPSATNTTYNFAMVSGNQQTVSSSSAPDNGYNGGLQNLPRFLENWGGINCNISGAFVNLWRSTIATAPYGEGNVYVPPTRFWDYDQSFETGKPPPGAPMAWSIGRTTYEEGVVRQGVWKTTQQLTTGQYDLQPYKPNQ